LKVALIAPDNLKCVELLGDMLFIIARNDMPKEICDFYRRTNYYKMMDNGVWETGEPIDQEAYLELAKELRVDEIILPDYLRDPKRTLEESRAFLETTSRRFKYAYVVHGYDPLEWLEYYREVPEEADVICIPVYMQKIYHCRPGLIGYLKKKGLLDPRPHHILGCDDLLELYAYPDNLIRSVDTSLPFSTAQQGISEFFVVPHKRVNLHHAEIKMERLLYRVKKLLEVAGQK